MRSRCIFIVLAFVGSLFSGCQDSNAVVDNNFEIPGRNWSYTEKVRVPFTIENVAVGYHVYVNLRHTADYKYSNIFLLIHITGPDGKKMTERKEFKLALSDGEWLGSGAGNLYTYQMPYKENHRFTAKGKYIIELEQNMRDNPLDEVSDAGIRIEKAN